ncbi:hypothetical protein BDN70DRAFT_938252 [Pholiota conissans]|uniref:Secreted protein n=1 Tax=Pholiota conissans TaxID=109636 RepID=A0A9P5YN47_9AGAR|nr:hypothetical protein BDN70DRAFT_938252 [Pholiota conissans]
MPPILLLLFNLLAAKAFTAASILFSLLGASVSKITCESDFSPPSELSFLQRWPPSFASSFGRPSRELERSCQWGGAGADENERSGARRPLGVIFGFKSLETTPGEGAGTACRRRGLGLMVTSDRLLSSAGATVVFVGRSYTSRSRAYNSHGPSWQMHAIQQSVRLPVGSFSADVHLLRISCQSTSVVSISLLV